MNCHGRGTRSDIAGFTLVEALVATALLGVVVTALSAVTARWLTNWNRGFARTERSERVSIAIDRLIADLSAAEFITADRNSRVPVFDGTSSRVTLVRTAFGPNAGPGLEIVRIMETSDRGVVVLVRGKMPFVAAAGRAAPSSTNFIDPVVLLRAPFRVAFAYAGPDGVWMDTWREVPRLPKQVRVTVFDAPSARTLAISTISSVHVELPAACVGAAAAKDKTTCFDGHREGEPENAPPPQPPDAAGSSSRNAVRSL